MKLVAEAPSGPSYPTDLAESYFDLGALLAATGRSQEAKDLYQKGIEVSPQSAWAHNNLAWMLATALDPAVHDPGLAVELATKAVELDPKPAYLWNTLGVAQYRAGEWKAAIDALAKAEEITPGRYFGFNAFFLAMAHWKLDQKDEARQVFNQAVEWMDKNQPENEELRRFRAEAAKLLELEKKRD
jgi:tetratricopeptide (TPR) repeat protein